MAEPTSVIEQIKQKLNIIDEIGAVVLLKKSGKAFKGLCPFHGERTPSFYVFPESGTWKCFGCNEGGDIFTFVEKQQGIEFREALQMLAEKAEVPLDRGGYDGESSERTQENATRQRLRALNEAAAIWFHHQLLRAPEAQYARSYLDSRGINSESIALWRLGYAPDGDRLSQYLLGQGYSAQELVTAGLAREREAQRGGGLYDYFRNRLIFPIRDARGQSIAFGGRELGGGHPKYLNTPQTILFDKSSTLYGLDLAREGIRRSDRVVIVEGYVDVVVPHQYGFRNVVACIGSAITEKHIRQIKKLTRRVALALDPDAAGESATLRGITVAQQAFDRMIVPVPIALNGPARDRRGEPKGIVRFEEQVDAEITVVRLPPHEDPDEFVRRDQEGWRAAVERAQPLIDYLIEAQTADLDISTAHGKLEATRRILPMIAEVRDRTLSESYMKRLAARIRLDEVDLRRDLADTRQKLAREHRTTNRRTEQMEGSNEADSRESVETLGQKSSESKHESPVTSYSASTAASHPVAGFASRLLAGQALEEYCLGLLLDYPPVWAEIQGILTESDFTMTEARALFRAFDSVIREDPGIDGDAFAAMLPEELRPAALRARERITRGRRLEGQAILKDARIAAYRLKLTRLKEEMAELVYLERDAEQSGDSDTLRTLLTRKQHLFSQRRAVDAASRLQG